jgi:hypothetical protein
MKIRETCLLLKKRKEMNMSGQQRPKNQKPLPQEGVVELSDEQLEDVAGGGPGSPAAAQYRYNEGYLSVLQFAFRAEEPQRTNVTVVNQNVTNNNISAQAGNQTGVVVSQNNRKK